MSTYHWYIKWVLDSSVSFTVIVQDTTPPTIDPASNITTKAGDSNGAKVNYTAPATTDIVDGAGTANCTPISGSLFSIGDTVVTCIANDSHQNSAKSITFVVHVTNVGTGNTNGQPGVTDGNAVDDNGPLALFGVAPLLIPVTGGQATDLSCNEPSTTLKMAGFQVVFANLCGYSAMLQEAPEASLFRALPIGNKFVSGINIILLHNGVAVSTLPAGAKITLSYEIPSGSTGGIPVILFWNSAANGGVGAWAEKSVSIDGGKVTSKINMPGTFVLVDKSTSTGTKEPTHIATTLKDIYLAVFDFLNRRWLIASNSGG